MKREDIAACIPHRGSMCVLDEVTYHDACAIVCRATSHRSPNNPLRCEGRLPALAGIEYAAQALAVHCALLNRDPDAHATHGMLAGVRAITLHTDRLDNIAGMLTVRVERLVEHDRRLLYAFTITAGKRRLLDGRVAVALETRENII